MRRNARWMIVFAVVLGVSVAVADKLSDFTEAVGKTGCDSIPYSDLKNNCSSEQSHVHEYCDGSKGPVTCGNESITRQFKEAVEREKKILDELRVKKGRLESDRSSSTDEAEKERLAKELEDVEREIAAAETRVEQAEADLEARKELVDDAIETIGKCLDYRRAVMNVFAYAQDKARGETDADIVPLARQLNEKWEETKRGHAIAITDKENALENCKRSRP